MERMKSCTSVNSPFYVFGVARIADCIEAIERVETGPQEGQHDTQ